MGKNYVENSLKRFLKRKVKFTLGLMIAFLITGTFVFAENFNFDRNDYFLMEEVDKEKAEGYLNAMEFLSGLGSVDISANEDNYNSSDGKTNSIKIEKDSNGDYKFTLGSTTITGEIKINENLISKKTAEVMKNAIKVKDYQELSVDFNESENNGFIRFSGSQAQVGNQITNNGIINGYRGQKGTGDNAKVINNGMLIGSANVQNIGNLINNGFIFAGNGNAQNGKDVYNYGTISATGIGQIGKSAYNYGIIKGATGQKIDSGIGENYGIIISSSIGQEAYSGTSKAYNYGVIDTTGNGMKHAQSTSLYNYGLIKVTNGYGIGNHATSSAGETINRGVIHSSSNSIIFEEGKKEIINTGIVITNADVKDKDWAKTGVTLGVDYTLKNTDTAVDMIKENTITNNTLDNSSFGSENIGYIHTNDKNTIKISDITVKRDEEGNFDRKVLGVVAEQNSTIFENAEENALLLNGIDITGYLINGGTLIDTNDKDLILSDVTITVTEDLTLTKGEKAIAVDLGTNGNLVLMGEKSKINGVIKGGNKIKAVAQQNNNLTTKDSGVLRFENAEYENLEQINYTNVTLNGDAKKIETEFIYTSKDKENTITIGKDFVLGTADDYKTETVIKDSSKEGNKVNYIIENIDNIHGNISLGEGENTVTVKNIATKYDGQIDLGAGESDKFIVAGDTSTDAEGNPIVNTFNYNVVNAETVELSNGTWGDWDNAKGKITFDSNTKSDKIPNLYLGQDATMQITLKINGEVSDFEKFVTDKDNLGLNHAAITGTGKVKYLVGKDGLDNSKFISNKYHFEEGVNTNVSSIFKVDSNEDRTVVEVKSAEDFGFTAQERIIYEAYLEQIKADGSVNQDVITQINSLDSQGFKEQISKTNAYGTAYYTAGSVVAKDITETYVSAVQNFTKRAGKGEWLAQGKYVNSDTEFTGGSEVKGYDGDITGTVGMLEYGFTDNTSYGVVFGKGESEMDIDGGGKLDGDNIYMGLYAKHRTLNGIELVADIGYMENDMESLLRNDFNFNNTDISSQGKTFEKGTADSSTVSFGVKGRKDYRISDSVKLQPTLGARLTFINQEEAENPEMHFTIKEQDIMVFEGTAGLGIAKEITLSQGTLELSAGAEYTFAVSSSTNDAEYTLFKDTANYQDTHIKLEETDAAENTGKIYVGADYEHENGIGFNGKYEMMWSDKGDDSRITAGISYRF